MSGRGAGGITADLHDLFGLPVGATRHRFNHALRHGLPTSAATLTGARPVIDVDSAAVEISAVMRAWADAPASSALGTGTLTERERLCAKGHIAGTGRSLRGSTTLAKTLDGWLAVNLARDEDRESLPAVTNGRVGSDGDGWNEWLAGTPTTEALSRARLLGLAASTLPAHQTPDALTALPDPTHLPKSVGDQITVVDMSRLWAGPLAGALLSEAGMNVVRLIDEHSPPPVDPDDTAFDERLNSNKHEQRLPFADRSRLQAAIRNADILLTSMRPTALERFVHPREDAIHIAISAYGPGKGAHWSGFGDDCAVAGGLVAWRHGRPEFLGDAVADPLTGLLAATTALGMLRTGRRGRVNVSLARTAHWVSTRGPS